MKLIISAIPHGAGENYRRCGLLIPKGGVEVQVLDIDEDGPKQKRDEKGNMVDGGPYVIGRKTMDVLTEEAARGMISIRPATPFDAADGDVAALLQRVRELEAEARRSIAEFTRWKDQSDDAIANQERRIEELRKQLESADEAQRLASKREVELEGHLREARARIADLEAAQKPEGKEKPEKGGKGK